MTTYTPDSWTILEMKHGNQITYKVFAGWSGGYLHGDSWKLSSGIKTAELDEERKVYLFSNFSGSLYVCSANSQRLSGYMQSLLGGWLSSIEEGDGGAQIRRMDAEEIDALLGRTFE
jgi:hypothetical protein